MSVSSPRCVGSFVSTTVATRKKSCYIFEESRLFLNQDAGSTPERIMAQEPASRSNDVAEEHLASVLFLLGRQVESPSGKLKRPFSAAWQPRPAVLPAGMRRPISAAMLRQQQRASSPSLLLSYGSKTTSPRSANFMAGRDPMLPPQPRTRYRPTSAYVRSALRSAQDSEPPPRHQIGRVLSGGRPSSAPPRACA